MLGNPYASGLDLSSAGIAWGSNIDQKAWFYNPNDPGPNLDNYIVYVKAGGGTHSQYAPPQQGFFVHHVSTNITSTTLTVDNSARTHTTSEPFWKEGDGTPDLLYLQAT